MKIKLSKNKWEEMGKIAGWFKVPDFSDSPKIPLKDSKMMDDIAFNIVNCYPESMTQSQLVELEGRCKLFLSRGKGTIAYEANSAKVSSILSRIQWLLSKNKT